MATGRSFAEYVKDKCYNGLYEAAEKYALENLDRLNLHTWNISRIGNVEFSDARIQRIYVRDLLGMRVAFNVGIELELCVHDANHQEWVSHNCNCPIYGGTF